MWDESWGSFPFASRHDKDDANVLSAMVKGSSGSPVVDRLAIVVALACEFLRTRIWFEYVQSDSKWSDGAY